MFIHLISISCFTVLDVTVAIGALTIGRSCLYVSRIGRGVLNQIIAVPSISMKAFVYANTEAWFKKIRRTDLALQANDTRQRWIRI